MKNNSEIIIYQSEDGVIKVDVQADGDTIWASQAQIAKLFGVTPQNITIHLKNIFSDGELEENRTCKEFLQVHQEGSREVQRKTKMYK